MMTQPQVLANLLRAIAGGDNAKASKHDIVFLEAARWLEHIGAPAQQPASPDTAQAWRNQAEFLKVDGTWRCDDDSINAVLDHFLAEIERLHGHAQTQPNPITEDMTHTRSCGYFDGEIGCTCCLRERKALGTEQAMHRAWRKRAEEAEAELSALRRPAQRQPNREGLYDQNWKDADEFCRGAFGPFVVDVKQYTKIVAELMQHATDRALSSVTSTVRVYFGTDLAALADRIIGIQEDLPDEDDRNALGEAAHYLRKAASDAKMMTKERKVHS